MAERKLGVPRTDVERVMSHYGVTREKAEELIAQGVELPPRGTGLQNVNWVLVATGIGAIASGIAMVWVGLRGGSS